MSFRRERVALALVAFPMAVLAAFTLVPTALGVALAFFEWSGGDVGPGGAGRPAFVGWGHFASLAADDRFRAALVNTLAYVVLVVPASTVAGFVVAVPLHAPWFRGRLLARMVFFLPTIVSLVAVGFVWRWILDDHSGLLNWGLAQLGIHHPPSWLQSGRWPFAWIVLVSTWRQVGFCIVLYLAAFETISPRLYEAAEIDGATRLGLIRHVTWPQVWPMTLFLLVTGAISALQVFDVVFVMTGQQETPATTVLNLEIFRQFQFGHLGRASAIGVVILLLTAIVTAGLLLRPVRRVRMPRGAFAGGTER
ncbi:MAG: sugar ABC transporter permease [Phycisphaerales bacterium]|nr:sugar ABC transporter permease [Phycisphaerales bacterium]